MTATRVPRVIADFSPLPGSSDVVEPVPDLSEDGLLLGLIEDLVAEAGVDHEPLSLAAGSLMHHLARRRRHDLVVASVHHKEGKT